MIITQQLQRWRILLALALVFTLALSTTTLHAFEVEVQKKEGVYHIKASVECRCSIAHAWRELTNYDHLAEWVPNMRSSRVVERKSSGILIEQVGEIGEGVFSRTVKTQVLVIEQPQTQISTQIVAGDFKQYSASYKLTQKDGAVLLDYAATIEPAFFVLPIFDMLYLNRELKQQFDTLEKRLNNASMTTAPINPS